MKESKKLVLKGGEEIHYKYKNVKQLDLGLTPDEQLFLPDVVFQYLGRNNRVNLDVYRRLKEDGIIEGRAFDVTHVKPYTGKFIPLKTNEAIDYNRKHHLKLDNGTRAHFMPKNDKRGDRYPRRVEKK